MYLGSEKLDLRIISLYKVGNKTWFALLLWMINSHQQLHGSFNLRKKLANNPAQVFWPMFYWVKNNK